MITLNALYRGKTQVFESAGQTIRTAIKKQACQGQVRVLEKGLEGNEVANHKNALYAYCRPNYAFWQQELNLAQPWPGGTLGENLLLDGLDDTQLAIGDILEIGEVRLQVSGCRTPCGNLIRHLNQTAAFAADFQASGRTGFYLEVLQTGSIEAGMSVRLVKTTERSISVPELARFFMQAEPPLAEIEGILALPGLGVQMQSMLVAKLNRQRDLMRAQQGRWQGWRQLRVAKIEVESPEIRSFYLTPLPNEGPLAGYRAGQYLTVRLALEDGETISRCWSLSDYDESLGSYRLSIKREPNGRASRWMHEHVEPGDALAVLAPQGRFVLERSKLIKPVILLSAGVGITPMLAMLKAHAQRADSNLPSLYFIHVTQDKESHAFREEVDALVAGYEQFHRYYFYSKLSADALNAELGERAGRPDKAALTALFSGMGSWFADKWVEVAPHECHFYLCGPDAFMADMIRVLREMQVPAKSIFSESFTPSIDAEVPVEAGLASATVKLSKSELELKWQPDSGLSLLELAEQAGLKPAFSCRAGHCGLCRTRVIEGGVIYASEPEVELEQDETLLCCSWPKGELKLEL